MSNDVMPVINWFCYSCSYELNLHLKDFDSVWQLTFNKHAFSLIFGWNLPNANRVGHKTRASYPLLSVCILVHWQQRWELMTYRRALYIQRVLSCKSIRDGARQYIFIVEAMSGLPAHDLLQREMEHSSATFNQDHYWARLSFLFLFSVSVFLCVCLFLLECISSMLLNAKRQTGTGLTLKDKQWPWMSPSYRGKTHSLAVLGAEYKSFKL